MTTKLYYEDAYQTDFTATIIERGLTVAGQTWLVLNQTAFYPTGGGQPHDLGTIEDIPVASVELENDRIVHTLTAQLSEQVTSVNGKVDFDYRFDLMQQHTGQHIVSAIFKDLYGYETSSFHLGDISLTIDLSTDQLTTEQLALVERKANDVILQNLSIEKKFVTREDLSQYTLHKPIEVEGPIRLVIIPDIDTNGCGGLHPHTTSEVRLIKLLDTEKIKKKTRLSFLCGERAMRHYQMQHERVQAVATLLQTNHRNIASRLETVLEDRKEQQQLIKQLTEQLLPYEAERYIQSEDIVIVDYLPEKDMGQLQQLAQLIVNQKQESTTIFLTKNADFFSIIGVTHPDHSEHLQPLMQTLFKRWNGRGGGRPYTIQGSIQPDENLSSVQQEIKRLAKSAQSLS